MDNGEGGCAIFMILFWLMCVAAWITHVIVCIAAKAWLLLIAGALIFPVAIIHGIASWFGFSWT